MQDQHARSNTNGWLLRTECYVDMARHWVAWRHKMWASADTGAVRSTGMTVGQRTVRATVSHRDGYRDTECLVTKKFTKRVKSVVTSKGIEVGVESKWVKWCGVNWRDICEVILFWSEVKCSELRWSSFGQSTVYIRVNLFWGKLIMLWLFHLVCTLYCGCFDLFCNVWVFWKYVYLYIPCCLLFVLFFLYCFAYVYLYLFVLSVLV